MSKLDLVIKAVANETGKGGLTAETRFDSLGIDSLEFLSLVLEIERAFNCRIADADYAKLQTIGDLAARC